MTVKELKTIINDLPDDTEVKINSVLNEETGELTPVECDGFYHPEKKQVFLTPMIIAI